MIPVKEAIESGIWIHCEYSYRDVIYKFRLKVTSFRKINLKEVDEPEQINALDSNANLWLLEMEIINLTKEPLSPVYTSGMLVLVDQDGFKFHLFDDSHLRLSSDFGKKYRMDRFFGKDLNPKVKALGSIPFQLPDDDDAIYSISLKYEGVVREA